MINQLPLFEGYTVDLRLQQFRKIEKGQLLFIDFKSKVGKVLLKKYLETRD